MDCVIVQRGNVWVIAKKCELVRWREKKKGERYGGQQKRGDIIGNDDEDFVLIGWQTLINAFTKLLLPTTKWDISTDTILVL